LLLNDIGDRFALIGGVRLSRLLHLLDVASTIPNTGLIENSEIHKLNKPFPYTLLPVQIIFYLPRSLCRRLLGTILNLAIVLSYSSCGIHSETNVSMIRAANFFRGQQIRAKEFFSCHCYLQRGLSQDDFKMLKYVSIVCAQEIAVVQQNSRAILN
jgi:hypothetical protein